MLPGRVYLPLDPVSIARAYPAPPPGACYWGLPGLKPWRLSAGDSPPNPGVASGGPTFSHLTALRAAVRREAYGLSAQK